jgi:hypothetical protein
MNDTPPIFLVGSDRSGTTLLRKRLNERQNVYFSPTPTHFFHHLYYSTPFYGALEDDTNFMELISAAIDLCIIHFSPWDIDFDKRQVLQQYDEQFETRTLFLLTHLMMVEYAHKKGYTSYLCKDHHAYNYLYQILHFFPGARFIYLHRDPRDVILSETKRPSQTPALASLAHKWKREQLACFQLLAYPFKERTYTLSYETFITREEDMIDELITFMGVSKKDKDAHLDYNTGIQEWKNVNKETMTDNFGKYREGFSPGKNAIIEHICKDEMALLGYDREYLSDYNRWHAYAARIATLTNRLLGKIKPTTVEKRQSESYDRRMDFLRQFKHA